MLETCFREVEFRGLSEVGICKFSLWSAAISFLRNSGRSYRRVDLGNQWYQRCAESRLVQSACGLFSFFRLTLWTTGHTPIDNGTDIYAICDVIKSFFRTLPEPVIPSTMYFRFIDSASKLSASFWDRPASRHV